MKTGSLTPRQRHYKSYGLAGDCVFVTTTCLDFAPLFKRPEMADMMCARLIKDCMRYSIQLHAFVVMSNHLHFIVTVPKGKTISWVVNRIKTNSAGSMIGLLSTEEQQALSLQTGLGRRVFWQRSFHSFVLEKEPVFWQKVDYIHNNPSKAGLCSAHEDYRWSSAKWMYSGKWSDEFGLLDVERLLMSYERGA